MGETKWNPEIKMELEHRAIEVFKASLKKLKPQIKKNISIERNFGWSDYSELYDYIEHLERRIESALNEHDVVMDVQGKR